MQKLKSFGCSFIFGDDLRDSSRVGVYHTHSRLTWPALIAKHTDRLYYCNAKGGAGNLRILESILNSLNTEVDRTTLYVISWTWIDRFDYKSINDEWCSILPSDRNDISRAYYKNINSQYCDKLTSLTYINTAISALKKYNQPFLMTLLDQLVFEDEFHTSLATTELQKSVKDHIFLFDGLTFLEWSRKNNYPISSAGHPLEAAHRAAFEYIKNQSLV